MTIVRDSTRQVWRLVRDAGKQGMVAGRLIELLSALDAEKVYQIVGNLKARGYIKRAEGRGSAYLVDEDCKVPKGEQSTLGPGWDEPEEPPDTEHDRRPDVVVPPAVALGRVWPFLAPATPAPAPAADDDAQRLAIQGAVMATIKPAYAALKPAAPKPAPLICALASNGVMNMTRTSGEQVVLSADETRELFTWLSRLQSPGLLSLLAPEVRP